MTRDGGRRGGEGHRSRLHTAVPHALAFLFLFSSCVYFNTYYNAQRYFRQAEKARKEQEDSGGSVAIRAASSQNSARGAPPPRSARNTGSSRGRASRGSASSLYDRAARKASLVLEQYEDREDVDEGDLVDDALFILGRSFYWQRDYQDAARSFADLENNFPNSEFAEPAKYWRGLASEGMGIPGEAGVLYRELMDEAGEGTAAKAGLRLGELALEEEDFRTSIQEFNATLKAYPDTELQAKLWLRLGEAHRALDSPARRDSALMAFDRALESHPADEIEYLARLNKGRVLYEQGHVDGALDVYTALLKEGRFRSYEGQTRLLLGGFYQDRGLLNEAIDEFTKVRDDFPQTDVSAMALHKTGLLFLRERGDRIRAQEYLEEVTNEKRGSEGAVLAKETLRDLDQLDKQRAEINRADSLASVVPDSTTSSSSPVATPDSTSTTTPADTTGLQAASAESGQQSSVLSASPPRGRRNAMRRGAIGKKSMLELHFAVAEMYRDRLAMADSAAFFYEEILRRFPEREHRPRALYSLAWVHLEMRSDREAARTELEQLIEAYPRSEHANAGRRLLGLEESTSAEDAAGAEFARIESIMMDDISATGTYVPLLDDLSAAYPFTHTAVKAAFLAARSYENIGGQTDSLEAERRYAQILAESPKSAFADIVRDRQAAQQQGLLAKLEFELKSIDRALKPGERIELIAVEPDTADTVQLYRKHIGFALRAHRRGRNDEALELYELSLEDKQANPLALYGLGEIAWEEGYFEDAIDYFREALTFSKRMKGVQYRLFAYHVEEGREDSANHYLRAIVRGDRENPSVQSLRDEFPHLGGAEPENLEMSILESIQLPPPDERLDTPPAILGLSQDPMVRTSVEPIYPPEADGDSAQVVLDILIADDGRPEIIEVFEGEEPLAAAAVAAAQRYVFYPAERKSGERPFVWVELAIPMVPPSPVQQAVEAAPVEPIQVPAATPPLADTTAAAEGSRQ